MKKVILGLLLLLTNCQREQIAPRLLFRTWQQVAQNGLPTQGSLLVEFTSSGTLRYGQNKLPGGCCSPSRFKEMNRQIDFLGPATTDPSCAYVRCGAFPLTTGVVWQIERLTSTELVLADGNNRLVFR
ncbi:hypothetical protein [Fibrella arboris]|uniref:hypothetical protein n=1 Tax=Fibrella arboris TaxID=3242486 RepID=UPI003521982C